MISAVPKDWTDRKVVPLICLTWNIRSVTAISATSAVPFRSSMNRLPQGGSMIRIACGMMMRRIRWNGVMLIARAASC